MAKAILQLGIGATDCNANNLPDLCEGGGGCCVGGSCTVMTPTCCSSQGGTFLGMGFLCVGDCNADGIPDECQHGACCLDPGPPQVCVNTTQCACDDVYGNFAGVGTKCATINCLIIPMLVQPGDPDP